MKKNIFTTILIILIIKIGFSQNYQKCYFRPPVDFPIYLSGNFGELRPNHFHSGIDISIYKIGRRICASASGYVSRIKVSPRGYGNALYITHPNGLMTVYAHLHTFSKELNDYIEKTQYNLKRFDIDIYLKPSEFPIKRGETIGLGGNSGRSFGPHLHYEIRRAEKDIPLNTLNFDIKIKDNIKPTIYNLAIYPQNNNGFVEGKNSKKIFKVKPKNNNYFFDKTIKVFGEIAFSVEVKDFMNGSRSRLGIYTMELFIDEMKYYSFKMEEFSFYENRYTNSIMDYEEYKRTRRRFRKCFIEKGDYYSDREGTLNRGIINVNDNKKHKVKIIVKDINGNKSVLSFNIQGDTSFKNINIDKNCSGTKMLYSEDNYFIKEDIRIGFLKKTLYSDLCFKYSKKAKTEGLYSDIHKLHNIYTPIHKPLLLSIKALNLHKSQQRKALIVNIDERGRLYSFGGNYINGFVSSRVKVFGNYAIAVDEIPPIIKVINFKKGQNLSNKSKISFKIEDELSGIENYTAFIDGKFVLFKYDEKNKTISYTFDNHISFNKNHVLELTVFDKKNNKAFFKTNFFK